MTRLKIVDWNETYNPYMVHGQRKEIDIYLLGEGDNISEELVYLSLPGNGSFPLSDIVPPNYHTVYLVAGGRMTSTGSTLLYLGKVRNLDINLKVPQIFYNQERH